MELHKPTERVIGILRVISKNPGELTFSNISKMLSIPKSTLSPILKTLLELEIIVLDPATQMYTIGLGSFQIGQTYLHNINGLDIIKSHMRTIVGKCNETCQLGINHRNEVLYLTKVECSQPIKLMSSIGRNLPLYCTGLGRALLFDYSEDKIRDLYTDKMTQFTEFTNTDVDKLITIINEAKEKEYAVEKQEITSDACCIAVPLIINNKIQAALGISMPIFRATPSHVQLIIDLLKKHSKLISQELNSYNIKNII
ncbi:IclR family transcriptional regulator [Fusobacterium sp.]|uniref:IclR family transcriptional regulator n=1 Tax=Fusobacterium sp. TaxID=68766 RepID=UPI00396CE6AC